MTGAVLDRPASLFEGGTFGRGHTLEARLDAALRETRTNGSTECPVCDARMTLARAGAREAAECGSCGARLS
jgi:ribosomal protein L37AE/L43A